MKKEIIIAIIVGILLGLVITYGIYISKNTQENNQQTSVNETVLGSDDLEINQNQLAIHQPLDGVVVEEAVISITGTSLANNFIVIFVGDEETIIHADESGSFSTEVKLNSGGNILTIFAIDEQGLESKVERIVILDDENLQINEKDEASKSADYKNDKST